ncbi:MAG: hypothetical protein AB7T49_11455 [Oligoflexales bacterium]
MLNDELKEEILSGKVELDSKLRYLAEGDMLLTLDQVKEMYSNSLGLSNNACKPELRWPNGIRKLFGTSDSDRRS